MPGVGHSRAWSFPKPYNEKQSYLVHFRSCLAYAMAHHLPLTSTEPKLYAGWLSWLALVGQENFPTAKVLNFERDWVVVCLNKCSIRWISWM
eukprot:scaffold279_cov229-Pinguiococcus_pyrenoidosus.AAC.16